MRDHFEPINSSPENFNTVDFDAIIIGAGPAGSSAAILLACAGWSVALIEKQSFPRRKVCGECIAASNYPLLEALGIGAKFDASAGPELRKVALMRSNSKIVANLPAFNHEKYRWGRALGRETLDTLLLEQARLAGATILQPWSLQTIKGKAGNWYCEIRNEHSQVSHKLRASVAIAANGSWEPLPSDRPMRRLTRSASDLLAFKANFKEVQLDKEMLTLLSFNGGYGGMVTADSDLTTLACCIRRDKLEILRTASPGLSAGDIVEAMLKRECVGLKDALQPALREGNWLAAGPIAPGVKIDRNNGLFHIGNAAGEAHPIIGEGMSMALQSAWLLCAQLVHAKNSHNAHVVTWQQEAAKSYVAQWRQCFAPRLSLAATFAHTLMRPAPAVSLMALLKHWPGMLTVGAKIAGKVHCAVNPSVIKLLTTNNHQINTNSTVKLPINADQEC